MYKIKVYKFPMNSPEDISCLCEYIDKECINPKSIKIIIAKTEGNGRVNDFSRRLMVRAYTDLLIQKTNWPKEKIEEEVVIVASGGCEGVMSPHVTIFTREENKSKSNFKNKKKKLSIGISQTRILETAEIGTLIQVKEVAIAVRKAMKDAQIIDVEDVHYVQVKCPSLGLNAINYAFNNNLKLKTYDTKRSMGFSNGSSGLGIAFGLGEVKEDQLSEEVICTREDLFTTRGASSAGIEMKRAEVFVLGNSLYSDSNFVIGHSIMDDFLDGDAVKDALINAGLYFDCCPSDEQKRKVIQVFAKGQIDIRGQLRGRRTTFLTDSVLGTRPARGVINAVIASIIGDPAIYVSAGWGYHQGPIGGGVIAVIVKNDG